jgi:hypothetical protein
MINKILQSLFLLFLLGFLGCDYNKNKSREKPDVSAMKDEVKLMRFDQDLFGFQKVDFETHRQMMRSKYGSFYDFYVNQFIIGPRQPGDTADIDQAAISQFLKDGYMLRLQDSVQKHFSDTKKIEAELTQSLRYAKHYFPQITFPKAYTINSGFSIGAFTYENDVVGIGLDLYLGANNADYDSAGIYNYVRHKLSEEYIVRNTMEVIYNLYFEKNPAAPPTFFEAMVENGKRTYVLSYLVPDAPEHIIAGFTPDQAKWCTANENSIWQFFNDKDLLYKTDMMEQKRYLFEGPTASGMPAEAPGNIGTWVGWQIVKKYMNESKGKVSLATLVNTDANEIIRQSKYRPNK